MGENKTVIPQGFDAISGSLVFGLSPTSPVISTLFGTSGPYIAADCRSLSAAQIHVHPINRAICALFSVAGDPNNDAISVIEALGQFGFGGEIVVLAPPLLRPKMVEAELRGLARGMRLRLMAGALPPLTEI